LTILNTPPKRFGLIIYFIAILIKVKTPALPQNKCYFERNRCLIKDVTLRQRLNTCRGSNDESTQQTRIDQGDPPTLSKGKKD
jgi:hypothetical protein